MKTFATRLSVSLAAALCVALPAFAEEFFDRSQLRNLEAGLVCPSDEVEYVPAPDTMLGQVRRSYGEQVVVKTKTVPMVKNLGFGVDVRPLGPRVFDPVTVTITHPAYKGTEITQESWTANIRPRRSNLNYFVFEYDKEMVPGTWIFTFTFEEKVILNVSFEVVPPDQYPNVSGLCDGDLLAALRETLKSF